MIQVPLSIEVVPATLRGWPMNLYPLVNMTNKRWKITTFNRQINELNNSMAIYNSYVTLPKAKYFTKKTGK